MGGVLRKSLTISFVGSLLLAFSASAGTSAFEGIVRDPAGHPVKGADVRIEANFAKIVKSDDNGHYTCDGLAAGTYKVTLIVNGSVKASILNAKTQSGKRTQLNFELTPRTASVKTHRVWVPPATGTLIGGGQWIDVDENGNPVNPTDNTGISSVDRVSGRAIQGVRSGAPKLPGG